MNNDDTATITNTNTTTATTTAAATAATTDADVVFCSLFYCIWDIKDILSLC